MAKYRIKESGCGMWFMPQKRFLLFYLNISDGWYNTLDYAKKLIESDKKKPVYHSYN